MNNIIALIGMATTLVSAAAVVFPAYAQTSETVVAQSTTPSTTDVKPPTIDPKSLLGKCQGNWFERGSGITVYLVFKEATEDGVTGMIHVSNPRTGIRGTMNRDIPFAGKLSGEQLSLVAENLTVTLDTPGGRIQGGTWRGPSQNGGIRNVTCTP